MIWFVNLIFITVPNIKKQGSLIRTRLTSSSLRNDGERKYKENR
jgi:hypothetical protein